jgi:hypothetical protein
MKNNIRFVRNDEIDKIKQYFDKIGDKGKLVELQGKELRTWEQYATEIGKKLKFPEMYQKLRKEHIVDSYHDWLRDLSWYEQTEEYAIIIYDYSQFLKDERGNIRQGCFGNYSINKDMIICGFVDTILPWWEYEVEQCVVGGKAKPFNVYLIN